MLFASDLTSLGRQRTIDGCSETSAIDGTAAFESKCSSEVYASSCNKAHGKNDDGEYHDHLGSAAEEEEGCKLIKDLKDEGCDNSEDEKGGGGG